ncbi:MAG: alpha/beta fold hydrolase [Solirubrobacterales bacterium]
MGGTLKPDPTPAEGPDPYANPDPDPEWLRVDWRQRLGRARVGSAEVNYVEAGSGPKTLLFVHGLSGSWQNWLEQLPAFAATHRVVALDLPGFGGSPMPEWEISVEAYGRLLHDFCESAGIERCAVIGSSMGGFIAAEAVSSEQERFERLVLVSAAGVSHAEWRKEPAEALGRVAAAAAPMALAWQKRALRRPGLRRLAFRQLVHWPLRIRRELLWEQFAHGAAKPGFLPALRSLVGYDLLDRLEQVELPALIVWGREDRIVPSEDAAGYARRLRNSQTVIMAETGHLPQLERPARFNRALAAFLR